MTRQIIIWNLNLTLLCVMGHIFIVVNTETENPIHNNSNNENKHNNIPLVKRQGYWFYE